VQRTTWSDGTAIVVNFGAGAYALEGRLARDFLPPHADAHGVAPPGREKLETGCFR
jgi:hypothetical protein